MYTKQSLISCLESLQVDQSGTLMVHFSYKAIGEVEGRGNTVLDAFCEYMKEGLLVLPSHTWANVNAESNPIMDVVYTPSCVGVLPELFRKRENVCRSLHPTHSVAAFGVGAAEFVSGEEKIQTPCGRGGVYYKLWERNAQILLIGVNFTRNTFVHGIEEWDNTIMPVSSDLTDLYVINYEGNRIYTPQYRHSRLIAPHSSNTFTKLEPKAINEGILTMERFGDASARLMRAKPLREMTAELLENDAGWLMRY